jgi:hypothetical protein
MKNWGTRRAPRRLQDIQPCCICGIQEAYKNEHLWVFNEIFKLQNYYIETSAAIQVRCKPKAYKLLVKQQNKLGQRRKHGVSGFWLGDTFSLTKE